MSQHSRANACWDTTCSLLCLKPFSRNNHSQPHAKLLLMELCCGICCWCLYKTRLQDGGRGGQTVIGRDASAEYANMRLVVKRKDDLTEESS